MKRVIYIAGIDRFVTLGQYVEAIKRAKTNREIMRQFREGVVDRINQGISYSQRGRRGKN